MVKIRIGRKVVEHTQASLYLHKKLLKRKGKFMAFSEDKVETGVCGSNTEDVSSKTCKCLKVNSKLTAQI